MLPENIPERNARKIKTVKDSLKPKKQRANSVTIFARPSLTPGIGIKARGLKFSAIEMTSASVVSIEIYEIFFATFINFTPFCFLG